MNLIYDRTAEDVERALALAKKAEAGTLTDTEKTEWLAGMKGCYNAADMNRVEAAVKQLAAELNAAGYPVAVEPVLKGGSRLPSGYTEVEYIQSSGTQKIDADIYAESDIEVEIEFACLSNGCTENAIFGASWAANGFFLLAYQQGGGLRWHSCGASVDVTVDLLQRNTVKCAASSITVNGTSYALSGTGTDEVKKIILFGVADTKGYSGAKNGIYKLYCCKLYKSGILIRYYIPAKNSSGEIGLYDLVNSAFYTNVGSGVFTAGAEISALEDRDWRESDIVRLSQWRQYLANVQALRDAYYTLAETGQLPGTEDRLDYAGANTVEKILADIDLLIGWMKSSYRRCGTFRAGNNAAHLPLKGSA